MPTYSGLSWIDWAIIITYAISTILLGWYFGRKQKSTQEYFVGSGQMNSLLIGVSLFATLLSTISYLSFPGEIIGKGPVFMTRLLAMPIAYFFVAFWVIPIYMKQKVTSAYELLEEELGVGLRMLGVCMFLITRLVWMSLLIHLTAKAMVTMLGLDDEWTRNIVVITGTVAIIYTSLGGLRAVVITDLLQTILLFGGAVLVIAIVTWDFGGFGWFPTTWHSNWDSQPLFSLDPQVRVTLFGTVLYTFVWYLCTAAGDQVSVQRFMATKDASSARRAYLTQLVVGALIGVTLCLVGFALLSYFKEHPEYVQNDQFNLTTKADKVFPYFIGSRLPVGIAGLVVSAMFAAAMSSIDSGVNSITAVVTTDLLDRFGLRPEVKENNILFTRILAVCIGAIVILGSSFFDNVEGNITKVTQKTVNLLVTPIFSLFFFALFYKRTRRLGVWIGTFAGIVSAAILSFSGACVYLLYTHFQVDPAIFGTKLITMTAADGKLIETAKDPVSFQWIGPVSLIVDIGIGILVCQLVNAINPKGRAPQSDIKNST